MREAAILIVVILRVIIENLKYARNGASGTKLCQSNIFSKLNFYRDKVLMTMKKASVLIFGCSLNDNNQQSMTTRKEVVRVVLIIWILFFNIFKTTLLRI